MAKAGKQSQQLPRFQLHSRNDRKRQLDNPELIFHSNQEQGHAPAMDIQTVIRYKHGAAAAKRLLNFYPLQHFIYYLEVVGLIYLSEAERINSPYCIDISGIWCSNCIAVLLCRKRRKYHPTDLENILSYSYIYHNLQTLHDMWSELCCAL